MRHIVHYSKTFDLPILDHCGDRLLEAEGVMHEGEWSVLLGMKGMPSAAEELMIYRDIILSRMTNWKIHIQHVSAKESVAILRQARREGIRVTGEATPHHIALTDVEIKRFDSNYKMNPPLRSEEDRLALLEGLADDTLTVIATDHAPHTATEKMVEFDYCAVRHHRTGNGGADLHDGAVPQGRAYAAAPDFQTDKGTGGGARSGDRVPENGTAGGYHDSGSGPGDRG